LAEEKSQSLDSSPQPAEQMYFKK